MAAPEDSVPSTNNSAVMPSSRNTIVRLESLNHTFTTKMLTLTQSQPIKIGRKVNPRILAEPTNGIFDAKVLSRVHAEILFENSTVYIRDLKSSNGTFINGTRLSEEGVTSALFELHNDDQLEFGIDIVDDDGVTIVYKKVSCKVSILDAAEAISWALMSNTSLGANKNTTMTSFDQAQFQSTQNQHDQQDQHARFVSAKVVAEAHTILDNEIRVASNAANVLKHIRKSFELIEEQALTQPEHRTLMAEGHESGGISQLLTAANTQEIISAKKDIAISKSMALSSEHIQSQLSPEYIKQVDDIATKHDVLAAKVSKLDADTKLHDAKLTKVQESVAEISQRSFTTSTSIDTLVAALAEADTPDATVSDAAAALTTCIKNTSLALAKITAVDERLDYTTTLFKDTQLNAFTRMQHQLDEFRLEANGIVTASTHQTTKELAEVKTKLQSEIKTLNSGTLKRLEGLDKAISNIKEHTRLQHTESERVQAIVDSAKKEVGEVIKMEKGFDTRLGGVVDDMDEMRALISSLRKEIEQMKKSVETASTVAASARERAERAEKLLNANYAVGEHGLTNAIPNEISTPSQESRSGIITQRRRKYKSHDDLKECAELKPAKTNGSDDKSFVKRKDISVKTSSGATSFHAHSSLKTFGFAMVYAVLGAACFYIAMQLVTS
ncbi:hypothetical protein BATDEDRAFT_26482 [Batrachochytrium dendrobatidis JAM81]|uniref:FHA domain-containing protein n=1 Tax=Batrachochytrium dendrobatidis (strain JAM81 / FGSC 10211) TaxID=684364 RepID=F4P7M5_BATDJ|nr:uncharacterized protein BATDEDRAFT_26482 [Batrachochytrium dendrobatidis JAM81]EGF78630.1 hypothetical protein BATDEDRAFT_26482 [Batrachochytrium dendrobatidis JAM81]|eukprot:XP_006680678.1 hypothetical protein BATDEDRAFT_26482 [Batrachochytrium dendrobatidis JAM81]